MPAIGLIDFGRLARNAGAYADIAASAPRLSGVQLQGLRDGAKTQASLVGKQIAALERGIKSGEVTGAQPALDALVTAKQALVDAHLVITSDATKVRSWTLKPAGYGAIYDARAAEDSLRLASRSLADADAATRDLPGTWRISREASRYVVQPGEPGNVEAAVPDIATLPEHLRPLMSFDPALQERAIGAWGATGGRAVGLQVTGLEKIPTTGPTIVTSTHSSYLDSPELLGAIIRSGAPTARIMAAAPVAAAMGTPARNAGVFATAALVDGKRVLGAEVAQAVLEQRQTLALFPEGDVFALRNGASVEPKPGVAMLASRTGATISPSAMYGLQGRRALAGEVRGTPQLVIGDPITVRRAPASASASDVRAQTDEVLEIYAQAHDTLLQQAVARYRGSAT
ncbi:MAG: 1-acyl-sn-glycerol-3-phosphate acyltransferase [Thermoleophilia bacterium]|nr:1-acyl-sn-glycerol-3-phosphate acyltransferase [Thermoleophilia bacterium]